jgi:hypothetical protein
VSGPGPAEIEDVALLAARALERLGLRYLVGGSVASSLYGEPRATNDIDFLVELPEDCVEALARELGNDFAVDVEALRGAARSRRSWNIFYLPLVTKVDLFIKQDDAFDESALSRRLFVPLSPNGPGLYVAAPEDVILRKLTWYRAGGEASDSQLRDVRGVFSVSGARIDRQYLKTWATSLGVEDLLQRVLPPA